MVRLAAAAEMWLGKPIIAINTATYWHALRANGIKDQHGRLRPPVGGILMVLGRGMPPLRNLLDVAQRLDHRRPHHIAPVLLRILDDAAQFVVVGAARLGLLRIQDGAIAKRRLLHDVQRDFAPLTAIALQRIERRAANDLDQFPARLNASWMPPLSPMPPSGLFTCAASPAITMRPFT